MSFDPRSYSAPIAAALSQLRDPYDRAVQSNRITQEESKKHLQEQKSQAQELYSYLSTWGLLRLKGEEFSLNKWQGKSINDIPIRQRATQSQEGRREIVEKFFHCLQQISGTQNLIETEGLNTLNQQNTDTEKYLGLMGIALEIAKEFSFWANSVYYDIKAGE